METSQQTSTSQGRYYHDKKVFINSQIRLLEAPIQPPADWRRHRARLNSEGETQKSIPDAIVQAALSKLHATSNKSSRLTFNNQTVRQLLEQLESNQYELRRKARKGGIIIRTKPVQELLESDWIDMFPETWQQQQGDGEEPESLSSTGGEQSSSTPAPSIARPLATTRLQKYSDVRSRIVALQHKYQSLKDKHEYYKTLKTDVQRLDAGEIEKNILSSSSPVVTQLEKTKMLLPKIIDLLNARRDVLTAKRKHEELGIDTIKMIKKHRHQSIDPHGALIDYLQE
ncbi:hypothetical protein BGZ46_004445 [Entomortierella lignicola]|nr:hypothetical protein BGZ46_004445 [Entomortierella lignicola]